MSSLSILDLLTTYVQLNALLFDTVGLSPHEACLRLMWDVPIDPDEIDLPLLIERACNG